VVCTLSTVDVLPAHIVYAIIALRHRRMSCVVLSYSIAVSFGTILYLQIEDKVIDTQQGHFYNPLANDHDFSRYFLGARQMTIKVFFV